MTNDTHARASGAGIAERLRQWAEPTPHTRAHEPGYTVLISAASHIEAQDAEIARLRAADVLGIVARQAAEWRAEAETMGRIVRGAHTAGDLHTMAGAADKLFLSLKTALAPQETQP
jgi:hypothetical protein